MNEPKIYFENEDEANSLLKEWKNRLFLNNWNIELIDVDSLEDNNAGLSYAQWVNSCGTIKILSEKKLKEKEPFIEKLPHEKILIHELLHFKYMGIEGDDSLESTYYMEKQHQLLEQMAKSLYMAKYDLSYEWFKEVI